MALFDQALLRPWRNTPPLDGRMTARSMRSLWMPARAGPAPSSGRGLDEVDGAGFSSMRPGRVDAEGPSVPGGLDVLR
jgi:hypothetical protein